MFTSTRPVLHRYKIGGVKLEVYDQPGSCAADYVAGELIMDHYGLRGLRFLAGDHVLDVGGHIGLFSIYLGLKYPSLRISSYEPHPENFELFDRNLSLNGVKNVLLYPEAISGDGRPVSLAGSSSNSGAYSARVLTLDYSPVREIPSLTLDKMLDRDGIHQCKLLKIDCEGSEYEALMATQSLPRIERMCGEFHSNKLLESRGHSPHNLLKYCEDRLTPSRVRVEFQAMSE